MPSASTNNEVFSSTAAESSLLVRARPVSVATWNSRLMAASGATGCRDATLHPLPGDDHEQRTGGPDDELGIGQLRLEPGRRRGIGDEHSPGEEAEQRRTEHDDD